MMFCGFNVVSRLGQGRSVVLSRLTNVTVRIPESGIRSLGSSSVFYKNETKKLTDMDDKDGWISRYLGPMSCVAKSQTNRWGVFVPAFATHLALGAAYGWSAISDMISKEYGFVVSSAEDWGLDLCTYPMSIMITCAGISAAILGKWTMKVGTRASLVVGGTVYGSAWVVTGLGVTTHSLPLVYLGNVLAGIGSGCAYTPPIQALIEWFPDKRGLATGIVISGFGSGALFFAPIMSSLTRAYSSLPTYLGNQAEIITEGGKLFAKVGDALQEVVFATSKDLSKLPFSDLSEGYYLVGSGNTGVGPSLMTIGVIYASVILSSAFVIRIAKPGYVPEGYIPPKLAEGSSVQGNVHTNSLLKTPQFWLLFATSTLLCTGGMGLISVAKPMISDVFNSSMPHVVTASFASSYLLAMAGGNLVGRFGWAAFSDKIGRRATFNIFTFGAVPIFMGLPFFINGVVTDPNGPLATAFLGCFCLSTVAAISIMGGTFAVLPAYEADLFGPKYVQAIHGRFLLAGTASTLLGPALLLNLRKMSESAALQELLTKVDPVKFKDLFGADIGQAQNLIEAKTLTISKLMAIVPNGTIDPSPFIYNNTMYAMASLVSLGAAMHFLVRPVDKKYFEQD